MQPEVAMVALYADRPQFIIRMLASFRAQTYENKWLLIYDNGHVPFQADLEPREVLVREEASTKRTIGVLRNAANLITHTEVIAHLDVDDWSHPNRITEQVALLQASGKECVGYRDMLFWRTFKSRVMCDSFGGDGPDGSVMVDRAETWLYHNGDTGYCLGTSLCYWRKVWEQRPFPDAPKPGGKGEDSIWIEKVESLGRTSLTDYNPMGHVFSREPRIIAAIHGENTSDYTMLLAKAAAGETHNWRRAPEWTEYCRERMAL